MITASQLRAGAAIRFENQPYKVLAADYHPGQGKMGGANHVRLRNLATGTQWEHSFRADLKLEEIPVERVTLEFLYENAGDCCFMNPDTYEQIEMRADAIGPAVRFLEPGMRLPVEFIDGQPVSVVFPDVVEAAVAETDPPIHAVADGPWKPARLANGVQVMVPPFIKTGDAIRLNLATLKYMDRAKGKPAGI